VFAFETRNLKLETASRRGYPRITRGLTLGYEHKMWGLLGDLLRETHRMWGFTHFLTFFFEKGTSKFATRFVANSTRARDDNFAQGNILKI
jgi:hypothetical protein